MTGTPQDKDDIREVLAKYCTFGDNGRFQELAALFAEDGVWEGKMGKAQGRAEIEALMLRTNPPPGQGPVRRHLVTNIVIAVEGTLASVQSTFLMLRESETGPMIGAVGAYNDRLSRESGSWLFRSRKVTPEIIGDARLK
jgi:SnoaL-like domain